MFLYGEKLADLQQKVFELIKQNIPPTPADVHALKNNDWINLAAKLAPNNLVVRNHCLTDLIDGKPSHISEILQQCNAICNKTFLWMEGYSYWLYVKDFLQEHTRRFVIPDIDIIIQAVDKNFAELSYRRNGVLYPPPFGDLRDTPLEEALQRFEPSKVDVTISTIHKSNNVYFIKPFYLGFNLHTPNEEVTYIVDTGIPINMKTQQSFIWYTGYSNKYKSFWQELEAMLKWTRIKSLFRRR